MKTSIKTLVSAAICAIVLLSTWATPTQARQQVNPAHRISLSKFKKINVSGNVDVLLVQNKKTGVIVDGDSSFPALKVTQKGETLTIANKQTERVKVTVYVDDILYRVDASENVHVKTFGTLNLKYLQVFLHHNAEANIDANTESLYTVVAHKAKLNLSGNSAHHTVVMSKFAMLTMKNFIAGKSDMSYSDDVAMLVR